MRCPGCLQTMHLSADECPHCGLRLEQLDALYAQFDRTVGSPYDAAGVLRVSERKQVAKWISQIQKSFPQLYFAVASCSLSDAQNVRSFGFWLMNRGRFVTMPETAREDGCVLLVIDVNRKEVCLHLGYLLDTGMQEEAAFDVLTAGHPYLLESNYLQAIRLILKQVRKYVKSLRRKAIRAAKS